MEPFYQDNLTTLYHGDCLEVMAGLDMQFDAVICDPPYGTTACAWDSVIPFASMWAALKRLTRPRAAIVLFGSQPFTSALVMSNPKWFKYQWVWNKVKPNGMGYARFQPMRVTEDIAVFCSDVALYNPQISRRDAPRIYRNYSHSQVNSETLAKMDYDLTTDFLYPKNLLTFSNANQHERLHPTQKPLALMEYLIRTYTNEGDILLDFTSGSGTTLRAAKNLKRRAVGIERERHYCEVTVKRLAPEFEAAIVAPDVALDDLPLFAA